MKTKSSCSTLERLLDDSPEASYWAGFIAADGCIRQGGKEIKVELGAKDAKHVEKLKSFVGYHGNTKTRQAFTAYSTSIVPLFARKYGFVENKTCRGIAGLDWPEDNDLFLAMVIGFVDGDGTINRLHNRVDCHIQVKLHRSWLQELQSMADRTVALTGGTRKMAYINSRGYAIVIFSEHHIGVFLKRAARRLGLPVLDRKWSRIDEQFVGQGRLKREDERRHVIRRMMIDGLSKEEIAEALGVSSIIGIIGRHKEFFAEANYCGRRPRKVRNNGHVHNR